MVRLGGARRGRFETVALRDQDLGPVVREIFFLLGGEGLNVPRRWGLGHAKSIPGQLFKAQPSKVHAVHTGRNDHIAFVVEADEAAVEEVVGVGC